MGFSRKDVAAGMFAPLMYFREEFAHENSCSSTGW
jgi:hypothetical protein